MPKLIANMIARNEADRFLDPVLERLKDQVDLICLTDDNSTDDTIKVAKEHGARVLSREDPREESLFVTDESKLRNMSWRWLSDFAEPGDWVLAIDADEMFYCPSDEHLAKIMAQKQYNVVNISFYHMWNETHYRVDKAWRPGPSQRLFRFQEGGKFRERNLACGSEPTYVLDEVRRGRYLLNSGLSMQHLGYMRDEDKRSKYERYMKLDRGEFHSLAHIESIIDPDPRLQEFVWE